MIFRNRFYPMLALCVGLALALPAHAEKGSTNNLLHVVMEQISGSIQVERVFIKADRKSLTAVSGDLSHKSGAEAYFYAEPGYAEALVGRAFTSTVADTELVVIPYIGIERVTGEATRTRVSLFVSAESKITSGKIGVEGLFERKGVTGTFNKVFAYVDNDLLRLGPAYNTGAGAGARFEVTEGVTTLFVAVHRRQSTLGITRSF